MIFVVRTMVLFLSVFRHDYRLVLFSSCCGLVWCLCSGKLCSIGDPAALTEWQASSAIGAVCISRVGPTLTPSWPGKSRHSAVMSYVAQRLDTQDKFKESAGLTSRTWRGAAGGQEQAWNAN